MLETSPELQETKSIRNNPKNIVLKRTCIWKILPLQKKEYLQMGKNDESEEDCTRRKKKTCIVRGEECGVSEGKKILTIPL